MNVNMNTTVSKPATPWLMLFSRLFLFVGIQALIALGFFLAGSTHAWEASANWWPISVTLSNLICVVLLIQLFRAEGKRYWDIFRIQRKNILGDILILLGLFVIGGPLGYFPNPLLSKAFFGDSQLVLAFLIRPLPFWVVYASLILFPITQGLAELAVYFGYVMPRLEGSGLRSWLAITLPAILLGLQHIGVPLLFDTRYLLWRGLMYIPFAFFTGIVLHWRPRLLPYMAILHVLMDFSFAMMLISAAY
jgi:membrane protease YdiL (CAAX protease family)